MSDSVTITYVHGAGTGESYEESVERGSNYILLASRFTPPSHNIFKCWSVNGEQKAPGDAITVTANMTITALYDVNEFKIQYLPNGGTESMADEWVAKGSNYTIKACAFTPPTSKQFKEWNSAGDVYAPDDVLTNIQKDWIFTAVWEDEVSSIILRPPEGPLNYIFPDTKTPTHPDSEGRRDMILDGADYISTISISTSQFDARFMDFHVIVEKRDSERSHSLYRSLIQAPNTTEYIPIEYDLIIPGREPIRIGIDILYDLSLDLSDIDTSISNVIQLKFVNNPLLLVFNRPVECRDEGETYSAVMQNIDTVRIRMLRTSFNGDGTYNFMCMIQGLVNDMVVSNYDIGKSNILEPQGGVPNKIRLYISDKQPIDFELPVKDYSIVLADYGITENTTFDFEFITD